MKSKLQYNVNVVLAVDLKFIVATKQLQFSSILCSIILVIVN